MNSYHLSKDYYDKGGNDTERNFSKNCYYNLKPNEIVEIILEKINELPWY